MTSREPAPAVLGAVYDLGGRAALLDAASAQGGHLAAEEANRGGGLLGRTVQLALADGGGETAVAPGAGGRGDKRTAAQIASAARKAPWMAPSR